MKYALIYFSGILLGAAIGTNLDDRYYTPLLIGGVVLMLIFIFSGSKRNTQP